MIQTETVLDVADNSGAKRVACIKVLGGSKRRYAALGDIIVVSVQEAKDGPGARIKKGDVARAVVVRTTRKYQRADGTYIKFDTNSAILPLLSFLMFFNIFPTSSGWIMLLTLFSFISSNGKPNISQHL